MPKAPKKPKPKMNPRLLFFITPEKAQPPPPILESRAYSLGIQMASARELCHDLMDELGGNLPKGHPLLRSIAAGLRSLKAAEDQLVDSSIEWYPKMTWPVTVAYWREDLQRCNLNSL